MNILKSEPSFEQNSSSDGAYKANIWHCKFCICLTNCILAVFNSRHNMNICNIHQVYKNWIVYLFPKLRFAVTFTFFTLRQWNLPGFPSIRTGFPPRFPNLRGSRATLERCAGLLLTVYWVIFQDKEALIIHLYCTHHSQPGGSFSSEMGVCFGSGGNKRGGEKVGCKNTPCCT